MSLEWEWKRSTTTSAITSYVARGASTEYSLSDVVRDMVFPALCHDPSYRLWAQEDGGQWRVVGDYPTPKEAKDATEEFEKSKETR